MTNFQHSFCGILKGAIMLSGFVLLSVAGCARAQDVSTTPELDRDRLLSHVQVLASDEYEGRRTGLPSGAKALEYVKSQLSALPLVPCFEALTQPFSFSRRGSDIEINGTNVVGSIIGTSDSPKVIVITAHFDHVGVRGDEIYNGADDNASGTGALIEMARYFSANKPLHTIIFASLDAEEMGLQGARALVGSDCISTRQVALNVNMDMISRSEVGELYVAGTRHYPFLKPVVETVVARPGVSLLFGHDEPGTGSDDWTSSSDHGPFHGVGIPFLYFGVEDHPGYHNPTDDFENITPEFYVSASNTILDIVLTFDRSLDSLAAE